MIFTHVLNGGPLGVRSAPDTVPKNPRTPLNALSRPANNLAIPISRLSASDERCGSPLAGARTPYNPNGCNPIIVGQTGNREACCLATLGLFEQASGRASPAGPRAGGLAVREACCCCQARGLASGGAWSGPDRALVNVPVSVASGGQLARPTRRGPHARFAGCPASFASGGQGCRRGTRVFSADRALRIANPPRDRN
jgi:hypothetical protein